MAGLRILLPQSELDGIATVYCAHTLAREVAGALGATLRETASAVCAAPANLHPLLFSPEGWQVFAGYVAEVCGYPLPDFMPTVH